jgi:hypothetical protein
MPSDPQDIIQIVHDPAWFTASIAAGSALLGAIVGTIGTSIVSKQSAKSDRANQEAQRSREAAGHLIEAIYKLANDVTDATARNLPPELAIAANTFAQAVGTSLAWLTDPDLDVQAINHRELAMIVGLGGTQNLMRIPPEGLTKALTKHAEMVVEALEAHIKGKRPPKYVAPPLHDVAALDAWGNGGGGSG